MKLFIRPSKLEDIGHLMRFSKLRASGITSLPEDETLLRRKLELSQKAFASKGTALQEAHYLFVLQANDKVIGVSGIKTALGKSEPFFVYNLTSQIKRCDYLSLVYEMEILNFETINSLPTEIGSLFLEQRYRKRHFGRLLSFCRFFFMACNPERFSKVILAQLRGVSDKRGCPFWAAVGSKFYGISFDEAEFLRVNHPNAIAELFPRSPIYPAMLPKRAQQAIRVPHRNTIPAKLMLEKQGFGLSPYCDIFDAGPHLYAARDSIKVIEKSKTASAKIQTINKLTDYLISNHKMNFRATIAPAQEMEEHLAINKQTATLLNVKEGDTLRYLAL